MGNKLSNKIDKLSPIIFDINILYSDINCVTLGLSKIEFNKKNIFIKNIPFLYKDILYKYNNSKFTFLYNFNQSIQFTSNESKQLLKILYEIHSIKEYY